MIAPAVAEYLNAHCTPADDVLRDLAAETAATFPDAAAMQVSPDEGRLLTLLTQLTGAAYAVEVGVFTGYSAICIARGLAPGGRLLACDVSPEWTALARTYWRRAGVEDRIDLRIAPAADTLRALPADPVVDLAFLDADKTGYPQYYEAIVPRLRPGGLLVIDNVLLGGGVLDPQDTHPAAVAMRQLNETVLHDERVESVMLPVRDGVTLVRKRT
ncbi:class I SAM-dependent methyltransferase [Dactylosporangium aurantiacum]|uniref:Class I SAM-dependent methyltransferase n=1 Tax=Dactylosporangium aurantiacum TaxID=35754 RepID=A0A9Q9MJZ3_9ACTN|nr:class I SAM-dependent methyltransferase [Dactylosporangium aurantiacum]MDG6109861.1 class I SAM-dependent methyltransferase [Dactylosporangium aurantiacum]UWZ59604.1 class I SAM-dependent methyltransferase [Dactylosporangium aurantiacum]